MENSVLPRSNERYRSADPYPSSWNGYDDEDFYFNELLGNNSQAAHREYRNLEDQHQSLYANADVEFNLNPKFQTYGQHFDESFETYEPKRYGEPQPKPRYDQERKKKPAKKPADKHEKLAEQPKKRTLPLNEPDPKYESSDLSGYNQSSYDSNESSESSISSSSSSSSSTNSSNSISSLSSESTFRISSVSTEQSPTFSSIRTERNYIFSKYGAASSEVYYDHHHDHHIPVIEYPEYNSEFSSESFVTESANGDFYESDRLPTKMNFPDREVNELMPEGHHEQDQFLIWYHKEQHATKEREEKAMAAAEHAKQQAELADSRLQHAEYRAKLA